MLRKFFNAIVLLPLAIVVVSFAVANRHMVKVSFDPINGADPVLSLNTQSGTEGTNLQEVAEAAWNRRAKPVEEPTHRHKKRGTEYVLLDFGKMQAEKWKEFQLVGDEWEDVRIDMREVAVYRSVDDGSLWVRPREEFEDGRFEPKT